MAIALGLRTLVKQFEIDTPWLDAYAEEEFALAEPILAALHFRLHKVQPHLDVAEEKACSNLEGLARLNKRVGTAVTFVYEGAWRPGELREGLLNQTVTAVIRSCPDKWCNSAVAKPLASAPSTAL